MGVIIEQRQPTAVAGIDDFGGGGDKDKKKRRPRRKQNSPPAGPSFNPGKQGEATKCSQSSCTSSPSVRQHMLKESDVAYVSMPTLHLSEQGLKHNLDAKANFKSCPTQVALKESVRSSLDVNFLPPFTEGCQQSYFEPHWSPEDVNEALSKGEVFEATFRVNAHNRLEAYCTIDGVTTDVLLSGIPVQNRAVLAPCCCKTQVFACDK